MVRKDIDMRIVFICKRTKTSSKSIRRIFRIENVMFVGRITWREIVLSILDGKMPIMLKNQVEMRLACENSQQKAGRMLARAELL